MNIEDIKKRVKNNNLLPSCDLIDLSSDVEYLISIIKQAEKAFEAICDLIDDESCGQAWIKSDEALEAIRGN